jgi:hypothetical protein
MSEWSEDHDGGTYPEDQMTRHELRKMFLIPFRCPHCGTGNNGAAGWIIEHDMLPCQNCSSNIDLSSVEWLIFRRRLDADLQGLQPLYDKVPQLKDCDRPPRSERPLKQPRATCHSGLVRGADVV